MIDYTALGVEVAKADYAGLTEDQIAAAINATSASVNAKVATADIRKYLFLHDLLLPIQGAAGASPPNGAAVTALAALSSFAELDTDDDAVRKKIDSQLGALVTAGLIAQADHDAVMAMAQRSIPLWQSFGHRELDHGDIIIAKGERWEDRWGAKA